MALVAFLFGVSGRTELTGHSLRLLLGDLGLSDDAARALLSRMHRRGQLTAERHGRETTYRLAGNLARGSEHIRTRARAGPPAWDGCFHTVLYRIPEESRRFRDALRRTAVMSGYGVLQPGILVAPGDYRSQLAALLADKPQQSQVLFGRLAMDAGDAARVVTTAWRLDEVAQIYESHITCIQRRLSKEQRRQGPDELRFFAETVAPALSATLHEPSVPADLLPADWPGPTLRRLVTEFSDRFGSAGGRHVASRLQSNPELAAKV